MGCFSSKQEDDGPSVIHEDGRAEKRTKDFRRPVWTSPTGPVTREQLQRMRDEFWDTQPHYGGDKVIWDALKAACESDQDTAKLIIETAGIIVASKDMTICYDERGALYELPPFVLSDPVNLAPSTSAAAA